MNLYPYFKEKALDSGHADNIDLNTEDIRLCFLNGYTYSAAHTHLDDVIAAATEEIGRSGALDSPTVTSGTFDAANETTAGLPSAKTITDVVVYQHSGVNSTSVVIAHIDEDQAAAALSLVTDGSPVTSTFHASGIFDL